MTARRYSIFIVLSLTVFILVISGCRKDPPPGNHFKTESVIIIVVDGPRYSETWGDNSHQYIPHLANDLFPFGTVFTTFSNNGPTYTTAGHTAITTGFYQEINNAGNELPQNPSLFQYYLKTTGKDSTAAWVIASKDKLEILRNCNDDEWKNKYLPSADCGINGGGIGSGYRHDSATFNQTISILSTYHPNIALINFREPDFSGHQNNWINYLQGITDTDYYSWMIWKYLQSDPFYANKTSLFITNDHGRHLDTVSVGFAGHGDTCEGCRHITLFAAGPDFSKNTIQTQVREQIDIPATIAYMLKFRMEGTEGKIMYELFE
ncbi:MAG: sulfatase [Crocinitomicaceae bacterium]|nr:sulfatase [Crocinitomicaceae bacterium]